MKYILLLTLFLSAALLPAAAAEQANTLNIIYTGGIKAELEPCGCSPKTDFGGVARLAGFLEAHGKTLSPYILIDAGNFSLKDTPQGRLKVVAMLESFSIIKYNAVAFMQNEQAFPDKFISPLIKSHTIPAISNQPLFKQSVLIDKAPFRINVSVDPDRSMEGMLNILLTDHPLPDPASAAGWDVVISSSGELNEDPVKTENTVFVTGYPKGEKAGILTVHLDEKATVVKFSNNWWPLGTDVDDDPGVRSVLDRYDAKVAKLLKESERPPAGTTYLGAAECAKCHQLFEDSWKQTRHAGAFASLEHVGKSADPECIICHVVGFGESGGFYSIETTPDLANVQCEECHGLDREHIDDFSRPMKPVTREVCLKCHTKENSPEFDYPVYLKKITH